MSKTNYELILEELKNNLPHEVRLYKNYIWCSREYAEGLIVKNPSREMIQTFYDLFNKSEKIYCVKLSDYKIAGLNMKNRFRLEFKNCDLTNLEFTDTLDRFTWLHFERCKGVKGFSIITYINVLILCRMNLANINVDEIKNIKSLSELEIHYCNLAKVPKFINDLQNTNSVSLSYNNIYKLPKTASTWKFDLIIDNNPICNKLNGKPATMENLIAISDMMRFRKFLTRYFAIVHHMPYHAIKAIMLFSLR